MAGQQAAARPSATQEQVRRALEGRRLDIGQLWFQLLLLGSLVVVFAILLSLLVDVLQLGLPVLIERGVAFLTGSTSSDASIAGVGQGIFGSLLIAMFVALLAFIAVRSA